MPAPTKPATCPDDNMDLLASLMSRTQITVKSTQYITYPARKPHHCLHFSYPTLSLVTSSEKCHLPPPSLVDQRDMPTASIFSPWTNADLQVSHILDRNAQQLGKPELQGLGSKVYMFVTTIDCLAVLDGRTELSAVGVEVAGEKFLRIAVEFDAILEMDDESYDFNEDEWAALLKVDRPWVQILEDVVHRKTARTYLAARQFLGKHDPELAKEDALMLAFRWMSKPARTPSQLFSARISHGEFVNGVCDVKLACNHVVPMLEASLHNVDEDRCLEEACPQCGAKVLQAADFEELNVLRLSSDMAYFRDDQEDWEPYSIAPPHTDCGKITAMDIILGMGAAMRSLMVPGLVESKLLAFYSCEETLLAVKAIMMCFRKGNETLSATPREIAELFEGVVRDALKQSCADAVAVVPTPSGWEDCLRLWLRRAVNCAFVDRPAQATQDEETEDRM